MASTHAGQWEAHSNKIVSAVSRMLEYVLDGMKVNAAEYYYKQTTFLKYGKEVPFDNRGVAEIFTKGLAVKISKHKKWQTLMKSLIRDQQRHARATMTR